MCGISQVVIPTHPKGVAVAVRTDEVG